MRFTLQNLKKGVALAIVLPGLFSDHVCASVMLFATEAELVAATGANGPISPPFRGASASPLTFGAFTISSDPGVPFGVANIVGLFTGSKLTVAGGPFFSNFELDIAFLSRAFGFTVGSSTHGAGVGDSLFEVSLLNSAAPVDTFQFTALANATQFIGFQSSSFFNEIHIREISGGPDTLNLGADQDREAFGRFFLVPEPSTLALLGIGTLGLLACSRLRARRRP